MAAGKFPFPTRAQSSFSHESPSFLRGHADQGGRPLAGSAAALLGRGDGGSRGAAGLSILGSGRPSMNGPKCPKCSRSFHGPVALYLHLKICLVPAPAAGAEPPAFVPQQERENRPSMARTTTTTTTTTTTRPRVPTTALEVLRRSVFPSLREEYLGMLRLELDEFVRAAEQIVSDELAVYMNSVPAVPRYPPVLNSAARPTAISDLHAAAAAAAAAGAIAPAPRAAAPATLAPAPFVPAAGAPMAFAAPLPTPSTFGRGSAHAGAGAGEGYASKECGETFWSGQALGGHAARRHHGATPSPARVPAANISSFPPAPGLAMRKRPATEAASPGNAKRRCTRLFGVDIDAPEA